MEGNNNNAVASPQFPAGLRILLVDDDLVCLENMTQMLQECHYQVTKCTRVDDALTELRAKKNEFDIMITDVQISDANDQQLIVVGLEMDIPVILISADEDLNMIIKGVARGAYYLVKPVSIESVKTIWQHVVRKRKCSWKELEEVEVSETSGDGPQKSQESSGFNSKGSKRKKEIGGEGGGCEHELEKDLPIPIKKTRVVWSVELHQQFVAAVEKLGIEKAVPKKILELMNVPELTRENVASHLQKYRIYLRRLQLQTASGNQVEDRLSGELPNQNLNAANQHVIPHHVMEQSHVSSFVDIIQEKRHMNVNIQTAYFGGGQQYPMIQSDFGNLILSHRAVGAVSGFNTAIRTEGGSSAMNGFPPMGLTNDPIPWISNHMTVLDSNSAANYYDPYNGFSHIRSDELELQNNLGMKFDGYHHNEQSLSGSTVGANQFTDNSMRIKSQSLPPMVSPSSMSFYPEQLYSTEEMESHHCRSSSTSTGHNLDSIFSTSIPWVLM